MGVVLADRVGFVYQREEFLDLTRVRDDGIVLGSGELQGARQCPSQRGQVKICWSRNGFSGSHVRIP